MFSNIIFMEKSFQNGLCVGGGEGGLKLKFLLFPSENVTCFYRLCNKPAL